MKSETIEKDRGKKRILEIIQKAQGSFITAGIHKGAGSYPEGKPDIVDVAFWNEFGTRQIPPRPFIRLTITQQYRYFQSKAKQLYGKVITLKTPLDQALDQLGFRVAASIQNTIKTARRWAEPNADSTIQRKTGYGVEEGVIQKGRKKGKKVSGIPLIDSGLLLRAISWAKTISGVRGPVNENPTNSFVARNIKNKQIMVGRKK